MKTHKLQYISYLETIKALGHFNGIKALVPRLRHYGTALIYKRCRNAPLPFLKRMGSLKIKASKNRSTAPPRGPLQRIPLARHEHKCATAQRLFKIDRNLNVKLI